jgi:uncharacterized protein YegP (UPF0339 family)
MSRIEVFEGKDKQHYVRVKAGNGRVLSTSEGYASEQGAEAGVEALQKAVLETVDQTTAQLVETDPADLDKFAHQYGELLHPTAVPSSAYVIEKDRTTLRNLLETAAEDGWTIIAPEAAQEEDDTDD